MRGLGDHIDRVRRRQNSSNSSNEILRRSAKTIDLHYEFRRSDESVLAGGHGSGAGVTSSTAKCQRMTFDARYCGDAANRLPNGFQHRTLLDMHFHEAQNSRGIASDRWNGCGLAAKALQSFP